jgi:hypothetical protein
MTNFKTGLHKNKAALLVRLSSQFLCIESCVENVAFNIRLRKILNNFVNKPKNRVQCYDRYGQQE